MELVVCATEELKTELLAWDLKDNARVHWIDKPENFFDHKRADAFIDLLFEDSAERTKILDKLAGKPVIINAVIPTLSGLPAGIARINGWNGFLKRSLIEASGNDKCEEVAEIFSHFNRTVEWIPDIPGLISARVISMIINEAYFALEEELSTREEIDTAMKLGTNYPYGPFEWSRLIGLEKIYELLNTLSIKEKRYQPAPLLVKEALLNTKE